MSTSGAAATPAPTGIRRQNRQTRRSVLVADRLADWTIRIGGIFVILAVATIMLFLAQVVVPLFTGAELQGRRGYTVAGTDRGVLNLNADENRTVGAMLLGDGSLSTFHLGTGAALAAPPLDLGGAAITAIGRTNGHQGILLGFANGTVRLGRMDFKAEVLRPEALPAGLRRLDDRDQTDGRAIFSRIPGGQFRRTSLEVRLDAPQRIAEAPIVAADYRVSGTVERPVTAFVTADANGVLRLSRAESRMNLLTRRLRTTIASAELPPLPAGTRVTALLLTASADSVYVGAADGTVHRYATRDFNAPRLAETGRLLPAGEGLARLDFLVGEQSLVVTGTRGTTDIFFRLDRKDPGTADGYRMVRAHRMEPHASAVVAVTASERGKLFVTADESGAVWLRHSTSNRTLLRLPGGGAGAAGAALLLAPRNDAVLSLARDGRASLWQISAPHPETTLGTLFGRVWYEGHEGPSFTWQSSAATDAFEPKLSLVPLVFGTLKATLYALLFAVPIALLAAIYTSEFLHPRVRALVKPAMEMMASLPSVVLGFIGALILAPIIEDWIAAVLAMVVLVPVGLVAAAYLWQLVPPPLARRLGGVPKLALLFLALFVGLLTSLAAGGLLERLVFAGDIKAWLAGQLGSGFPFTTLVLFPVALAATSLVGNRLLLPRIDAALGPIGPHRAALVALIRWAAVLGGALVLAALGALAAGALGFDPRGSLVGTYVQRNALVVGLAMGFAVIPIIYTIAEDALNSVPEHLRAASLACGGTTWQTATRVILPTALSGVFAAVMIGMGRAVGETMIVVMAAGNTPILDWNIFNGLRALSATIAVELPEAVRDGTLYRVLFLAALTLFVITFVINTAAELIRLRFRRRAASL